MAQAQKQQPQQKVLRIGVVQDGKIVQERLIKAGEAVTVGESTKNNFVLPTGSLPKRFQLFQPRKGGGYILHFTDEMQGKLSYKNAIVPLDQLKEQGDAVRKGAEYALPLNESNRGKVSVDGVTILFQFVPPPPEPMRSGAAMDFRPKLIDDDDPVFYGFLGLFTALAAVFMIYVYTTEPIERVALDEIPDRFVNVIVDSPEPVEAPELEVQDDLEGPEVAKAEKELAAEKAKAEKADKPKKEMSAAEKAAAEEKRKAALEQQVAQESLLLSMIGTRGENSSGERVEDLFGADDFAGQNLDQALATVSGAEVATDEALKSKTGTGSPTKGVDIGALQGAETGTGKVGVGSGPATKVTGTAGLGNPTDLLDEGEVSSIQKVVRKYKGQVKYCYDTALNKDPSVAGRVEIMFTVAKGRVANTSVSANTTGNDGLAKCIAGKVRNWKFPDGVAGDVIYPFILSPSN